MAKTVSLLVKLGALAFILFLPTTFSINFQLLSNIWIVQTLPTVFLGLYTNWFHRRALLIGLLSGLVTGTALVVAQNFLSSITTISFNGFNLSIYIAIAALAVNLLISVALTPLFRFMQVSAGEDATTPADFEAHPVSGSQPELLAAQISQPSVERAERLYSAPSRK